MWCGAIEDGYGQGNGEDWLNETRGIATLCFQEEREESVKKTKLVVKIKCLLENCQGLTTF